MPEGDLTYQAQQHRPDPLSFNDRPATGYAWDQAYRFHGMNPLTFLVYLAVAEDADRATHSPDGYSCIIAAEVASMLDLDKETIQPSLDWLGSQDVFPLLVQVPARLRFAIPSHGYRVSEAHFDPTQRGN